MAGPAGLRQRERPRLILLIGLPGAGKSTLARALAPHLRAMIVDRDTIRAQRFPETPVDAAITAIANAEVEDQIRARLAGGDSVIADGRTWASAHERGRLVDLARAAGAAVAQIWIDVPVAVAIERVEASRAIHPAGDRDATLVRGIAARFERPGPEALHLDGRRAIADLVDAVLARFQSGGKPPLE